MTEARDLEIAEKIVWMNVVSPQDHNDSRIEVMYYDYLVSHIKDTLKAERERVIDENKACLGCGHRLGDKLPKTAIACCPDHKYITAGQMWDEMFSYGRRCSDAGYERGRKEALKERTNQ